MPLATRAAAPFRYHPEVGPNPRQGSRPVIADLLSALLDGSDQRGGRREVHRQRRFRIYPRPGLLVQAPVDRKPDTSLPDLDQFAHGRTKRTASLRLSDLCSGVETERVVAIDRSR
jgi:hypothetical protein